jgi:hypothetical protein
MMKPPSSFGGGLLLYAACAVMAWMAWPYIKAAFDGNAGGGPQYDQYGYTGDPGRFDRWRQGGRGGYSDFYPGPHSAPQAHAPRPRRAGRRRRGPPR